MVGSHAFPGVPRGTPLASGPWRPIQLRASRSWSNAQRIRPGSILTPKNQREKAWFTPWSCIPRAPRRHRFAPSPRQRPIIRIQSLKVPSPQPRRPCIFKGPPATDAASPGASIEMRHRPRVAPARRPPISTNTRPRRDRSGSDAGRSASLAKANLSPRGAVHAGSTGQGLDEGPSEVALGGPLERTQPRRLAAASREATWHRASRSAGTRRTPPRPERPPFHARPPRTGPVPGRHQRVQTRSPRRAPEGSS